MTELRDQAVKQAVLRICPGKCLICGYDVSTPDGRPLVEGAHIRDFSEGSQYDVPANMVLLCPNHHTEYDNDLIDFTPDGTIFHYYLDNPFNGAHVCYDISYLHKGYIKNHNRKSFLRKRIVNEYLMIDDKR